MEEDMETMLGSMMYSPKYLESTTDFVLNSYNHHNGCEDAISVALHSGACVGYAMTMKWRVNLNMFFPFANGTILIEGDSGYEEALRKVRFKNYGEHMLLTNGFSRIVFNNGKELIFDAEGYAGDIVIERLLELTDELEFTYDFK